MLSKGCLLAKIVGGACVGLWHGRRWLERPIRTFLGRLALELDIGLQVGGCWIASRAGSVPSETGSSLRSCVRLGLLELDDRLLVIEVCMVSHCIVLGDHADQATALGRCILLVSLAADNVHEVGHLVVSIRAAHIAELLLLLHVLSHALDHAWDRRWLLRELSLAKSDWVTGLRVALLHGGSRFAFCAASLA